MSRCPITYEECGNDRYSKSGLRKLSQRLTDLKDFPLSADQQRREAVIRTGKMSIAGVQPKVSARLNVKGQVFEITDSGGQYIIKPQHETFHNLPENEAVTMSLASLAGLNVPLHGLVYCVDGSLSYFVKRFDRHGRNKKHAQEDFAQLCGKDRDTKYRSSVEQVIKTCDEHCSFPMAEKVKLMEYLLFGFLSGNEDMHLKNFSLITKGEKVALAPAYDFLNTTVAFLDLSKPLSDIEESALTIRGRKKSLTRKDWIDYLGIERMGLSEKAVERSLGKFTVALSAWRDRISESFLPENQQDLYLELLNTRAERLDLSDD